MPIGTLNTPDKSVHQIVKRVFFTGTVAIYEGQGVCYDDDRGTAASVNHERGDRVELPTVASHDAFAGVVSKDYPANADGQWIEIFEPGSYCKVRVNVSATIGGFYTCSLSDVTADNGDFGAAGFLGRGTVKALQTVDGSSTDALCEAVLLTGDESGLNQVITLVESTSTGAQSVTPFGQTTMTGGVTPAADVTYTLADAAFQGAQKRFLLNGTIGTHDFVVTVTNGEQLDGATDLATLELDGDGDDSVLIFYGSAWQLVGNAGTGLA